MTGRSRTGKPRGGGGDGVGRGPFRIHTVAELTGVPEPTLRAWERRYGIPTPERTASGYRLYGAREVEQVREMRRLCSDGVAAAEAARQLLAVTAGTASPRSEERKPELDPYAASLAAVLEAVLGFDDDALDFELRKLMFLGSTMAILDRVLSPVLREIGRRWHEGELSVAQEHLASHRLGTMLRDLSRLAPGANGASRILLASFADDDHELGLLSAGTRLSTWGYRPVFLGARTPPPAVRSAVKAMSPALVALSVTITPNRSRARELVEEYAVACGTVPWMIGGAAAPEVADIVRASGGLIAPEDPALLRAFVRGAIAGTLPAATAESKRGRMR